jgi:hypothetical protein
MPWDCEVTTQGNARIVLPCSFTARVLAVQISANNQKPTWYKSGFLRAIIDIDGSPFIGFDIPTTFGQQIIQVPLSNYQLDFAARVYTDLTTIKIKQLTQAESINIMGINVAPSTPEVLGDEVVTTVVASITNVVLDPANPTRRDGFIINKSNRNLWVKFAATAATAAVPTSLVTPGSNINGPTPTLNAEVHQFSAV